MSYEFSIGNVLLNMQRLIQVDELINQMTQSDISFRRCMLILCTLCIVAECEMYEKLCMLATSEHGLNSYASHMKSKCILKMRCLDMCIKTSTETKITFTDIESFIAAVLNPHLGIQFGRHLVETARKEMSEAHTFYNPRLLKDLARCKVRACVPSSMLLTAQVKQFKMPETLKEFTLFHSEGIWDLIIENQVSLNKTAQLKRRISEHENVRDNLG